MKVTFVIHDYTQGETILRHGWVEGNKPNEEDWKRAEENAQKSVADRTEEGKWDWCKANGFNYFPVRYVLKGWVEVINRDPVKSQEAA
jgi:hypothetical protein